MFTYAFVEIAGRQIKIKPDTTLKVGYLGDVKELTCEKVLLMCDKGSIKVGNPYLKESLKFEVLKSLKGPKIRVATYKAKANTRRVKGSRPILSEIKFKQTI